MCSQKFQLQQIPVCFLPMEKKEPCSRQHDDLHLDHPHRQNILN